jgi:hypothetical protein
VSFLTVLTEAAGCGGQVPEGGAEDRKRGLSGTALGALGARPVLAPEASEGRDAEEHRAARAAREWLIRGLRPDGRRTRLLIVLMTAVTCRVAAQGELTARELMRDVIASATASDETVSIRMELADSKNQVRQRTATLQAKKDPDGNVMRLIRFNSPADLAKSGILVLDRGDRDAEQWLYLPAYHASRRVAAANRSDTWMGTDFAYEDMSAPNVDRYDYRYLEDERFSGVDCRVVETVPLDEKLKKESGYSKTIYWIDPVRKIVMKADFFDKRGALAKELRHSRLETHGSHYRWAEWEMRNVARGHRTTLRFEDRKIDQGLEDRFFTVRFLERGG